jgi:hypothetical protein
MPRFLRILLVSLGLFLALLYPTYLGVGNWLLHGELERRINRRPESMQIRWRSARTVWPGVVQVEGFEIRGQTRTIQWWAAVDRARLTIDLWSLADRYFAAHDIEGEGVSFRLRRRTDATPRWRTDPALAPPIPGLANPPRRPPERIYPRRPRRRPPWRVDLGSMDLRATREIWIEEFRFRGDARAVGGFELTVRERVEVLPARFEIRSGELLRGRTPALAGLAGEVTGKMEPFDPGRFRGRKAFRFASGRVRLEGRTGDLGVVEQMLRRTPVELAGGAGPVVTDVRLRRGRFLPGSRMEARPQQVRVGFLDYQAAGSGQVVWEILARQGSAGEEDAERTGRLTARLDRFDLQRRGYSRPHVRGRGLAVVTSTPEPVFERLFFPVSLAIDMPEAEVQDLTFYNAYLPRRAGLVLRSGSGKISGRFRASSPDWVGSGRLALAGRGVVADYRDARLRGDFALDTRLARADLRDQELHIDGSDFEITGVSVAERGEGRPVPPGWWLRGHVDRGRLRPGRPVFLEAQMEASMRDPRPLISLFAPDGRAVRWIERMVEVRGVGATADVKLGDDLVEVSRLAAVGQGENGRDLEIQGGLRIRDGSPRGALYARWGRLDVGLEVEGKERDWKVLRPRKWFREASGF